MAGDLDVAMRLRALYDGAGAKNAKRDMEALQKAAGKFNGRGVGKTRTELDKMSGSAKKADRAVSELAREANRLNGRGADKLASGLDKVARSADRAAKARDRLGRYSRGGGSRSGGAGRSENRFGRDAMEEAANRFGGGHMLGLSRGGLIGGAVAGGVLAVAAGVKKTADESIKFETSMAEVQKAVNGLDDKGLAQLRQTILDISKTSPLAKEEIAKLVAQAGFAGRPNQDLARFAEFSAKAAVAFDMSAEQAGDSLAKLGNVFTLNQKGIEDLADTVNLLGDSTAAKEPEIINFLQRVGGGAKILGLSAQQAAAFGSAIMELGVAPEVAGTGFNALMTKIASVEKQGDEFQDGLKAMGLSAKKVRQIMDREGPAKALQTILQSIDKLPQAQKMGVLTDMFGMQYSDDVARMAGNMGGLAKALGLVANQATAAGSVERTFKIFTDTTQAKIDTLGNSFNTLATALGDKFSPALGRGAEALTEYLNKVTAVIEKSNEARKLAEENERLAGKIARGEGLTDGERKDLGSDPARADQVGFAAGKQAKASADEKVVQLSQGAVLNSPEMQAMRDEMTDLQMQFVAVEGKVRQFVASAADPAQAQARVQEGFSGWQAEKARLQSQMQVLQEQLDAFNRNRTAAERQGASDRVEAGKSGPTPTRPVNSVARRRGDAIKNRVLDALGDKAVATASLDSGGAAQADAKARELIQRLLTTFNSADLSPAAREMLARYAASIQAEGGQATAAAQAIAAQIKAALDITVSPTIAPRLVNPGATPAPAAPTGGTPGKQSSLRRGTTIGVAHFHGVRDPKAMERQLAAADRRARSQRDNALHDLGAIG